MSDLKLDIDCILESYELEIKLLINEAKDLLDRVEKDKDPSNYNSLLKEASDIMIRKDVLDSCKEDCIKNF